ncbi:NAD(P)H-hydrate dehydratase [Aquicoccus sp. G2-2]|uniref:NAD(P)H-hydrate dehydratase n=1 Tax=Aquicoccus sp. G2-2 TaxID=3092120 RepID=UPI002ADF9697|nr:NAD(P)H-hydrate dehydratase [Aquicoccus sp. G2-2]MEA1113467.1 NAD(P)H-hydrate dehydratase [Aquicoccus sp. G2-2]
MAEARTAAQMRAVEAEAIGAGKVTGLDLMERAGRGVVDAVFEAWPVLAQTSHKAVVLCGPGNNGGDGFVVARLLRQAGWAVEVLLFGVPSTLPPDAQENFDRWCAIGRVRRLETGAEPEDLRALNDALFETDAAHCVIFDALFGTGLTRPLGDLVYVLQDVLAIDEDEFDCRVYRVAVDMPSGVCSDSGRILLDDPEYHRISAFEADLTVTFDCLKLGHVLAEGPGLCGEVKLVDIGLPPRSPASSVCLSAPHIVTLSKGGMAHKYSHGHALILSGGAGRTGAARLAARGALRIGAGLVTLGVPGAAQMEVASAVTAVMLRRAGTAGELAAVLEDRRINAVCLGPGLGKERARALVEVVLGQGGLKTHPTRAVVLDADALAAFEDEPEVLFGMLHETCVLTPHGGEFARLFPDIAGKLAAPALKGPAYSKVDATREAAARAGCVVLFKGADTVIAHPDGSCSINSAAYEREAPWLATAGAGDVLAGFIVGLLARGLGAMAAAEAAAWLHVECARSYGPGLIAEDLPEELPKVFRALGV